MGASLGTARVDLSTGLNPARPTSRKLSACRERTLSFRGRDVSARSPNFQKSWSNLLAFLNSSEEHREWAVGNREWGPRKLFPIPHSLLPIPHSQYLH